MKSFRALCLAAIAAILLCLSLPAFADPAPAPTPGSPYPAFLPMLIDQAESLPSVGPAVKTFVVVAGAISGVATALSLFLMAVFGSLQGVFHSSGFLDAAAKVQAFSAKVLPWFQYWSMFNVQKPQPAPPPAPDPTQAQGQGTPDGSSSSNAA